MVSFHIFLFFSRVFLWMNSLIKFNIHFFCPF
jgi:hypothetical protein